MSGKVGGSACLCTRSVSSLTIWQQPQEHLRLGMASSLIHVGRGWGIGA
jgi:hypothetical protein